MQSPSPYFSAREKETGLLTAISTLYVVRWLGELKIERALCDRYVVCCTRLNLLYANIRSNRITRMKQQLRKYTSKGWVRTSTTFYLLIERF